MTVQNVSVSLQRANRRFPAPNAVLELFKPVTWFPPIWAFGCGVVSVGTDLKARGGLVLVGLAVAGPLVCATSQAVNDWFDRHVDAINEPGRPIPSGRVPGRWGLGLALLWTAVSLAVGTLLGPLGLAATAAGLVLAWAYSAPPFRLKRNGWIGNAAVGFSYEGLAWVTGAAVGAAGSMPAPIGFVLAALYSLGAHGIMTLNDFKSIEGDLRMGIGSLPARLGPDRAARVACAVMLVPQVVVVGLLFARGTVGWASLLAVMVAGQLPLMKRLLAAPRERAPWYNGTGVLLYVLGMLVSAFAIRPVLG